MNTSASSSAAGVASNSIMASWQQNVVNDVHYTIARQQIRRHAGRIGVAGQEAQLICRKTSTNASSVMIMQEGLKDLGCHMCTCGAAGVQNEARVS